MDENRIGKKAEKILGKAIAQLREQKGMTTLELGRAINEKRQEVEKYEAGGFVPLTVLEAIALVLDSQIRKQQIRRISFLRKLEIEKKVEQEELCDIYRTLFSDDD